MAILHDLLIRVKEVGGNCAAGYKVGDKIYIKAGNVDLSRTCKLCYTAMASLLPTLYAGQLGGEYYTDPEKAIMSNVKGKWYVHCPDVGNPPYRGESGGYVIFEITKLDETMAYEKGLMDRWASKVE